MQARRPRLTREVVRENATTYMEQFFNVVDRAKTEVRWQSEWFGTFDLDSTQLKRIKSGKQLFAIDQQQYLQGYLPVVFAVLFVTNLNTVGNGAPVLTGPGIINKANAAKVAALAKKGTR